MPENTIRIGRHTPKARLDRLVTQKVTEILNAMLDAEADEIAGRPDTSVPADGRRVMHRNPDMFRLGGTLEEASWSSCPGWP